MFRIFFITCTVTFLVGCGTVESAINNRDYLIGWYELRQRHYRTRKIIPGPVHLIPVFNRNGFYYSVCHGFEVPMKVCQEGLEWGIEKSSMKGTKIGIDKATKKPYIIINDRNAYLSDEADRNRKQYLTKISNPQKFPESSVAVPKTIDDFLGHYQAIFFPCRRFVVRKAGGIYYFDGQLYGKNGWKTLKHETVKLEVLPDRLGFACKVKGGGKFVYNCQLKRYECVSPLGTKASYVAPMARVNSSLPGINDQSTVIGIPSWR